MFYKYILFIYHLVSCSLNIEIDKIGIIPGFEGFEGFEGRNITATKRIYMFGHHTNYIHQHSCNYIHLPSINGLLCIKAIIFL